MKNQTIHNFLLGFNSFFLLFFILAYYGASLERNELKQAAQIKSTEQQITAQVIQDLNYQVDSLQQVINNRPHVK